jgi:uncharacterized protein (TIGR02246 family)
VAPRQQDLRAIQQVVADAERYQSDPEAFCRLLTQDATLINVVGVRLEGRDSVQRAMEEAMRTPLADVHTSNEVEHIAFLRPDVAVMTGTKRVSIERDGSLEPQTQARLTFVLVKEDGSWLVALIQNTLFDV